jgi:hypothetical protein
MLSNSVDITDSSVDEGIKVVLVVIVVILLVLAGFVLVEMDRDVARCDEYWLDCFFVLTL